MRCRKWQEAPRLDMICREQMPLEMIKYPTPMLFFPIFNVIIDVHVIKK